MNTEITSARRLSVEYVAELLGPVDKVRHPYPCSGQGEEGGEGFCCLVEARGDAAELLEPVKHALDPVAVFVGLKVAWGPVLAVCFWWDHRNDASQQQILAHSVAIVSFVGQEQSRLAHWHGHQGRNGCIVGCFSAGEDKAKRASLTVCAGVDFARKAAA